MYSGLVSSPSVKCDHSAIRSRLFNLEVLVSENSLSQSWIGTKIQSGDKCFLKVPSPKTPIGADNAKAILSRSFRLQQRIHSEDILRARAMHVEAGLVIIEYPVLDCDLSRPITTILGVANTPAILTEAAVIIDYLHFLGLVHGDLKLEHFYINNGTGTPHLTLIDLDFISESGASTGAIIRGTPGAIAPEILEENIILTQSDLYSFGISLGLHSADIGFSEMHSDNGGDAVGDGLNRFIAQLTSPFPYHRPVSLLEGLKEAGLLNGALFDRAQRQVLRMIAATHLGGRRGTPVRNLSHFHSCIQDACGIYGVPEELVEEIYELYVMNRSQGLEAIMGIISDAGVARHGHCWQISLTDSVLARVFKKIDGMMYRECNDTADASMAQGQWHEVFDSAVRLRHSGRNLRSYLALKSLIDNVCGEDCSPRMLPKAEYYSQLGETAQLLGRNQEAINFLESALSASQENPQRALKLIFDVLYLHLISGNSKRCEELIAYGLGLCERISDERSRVALLRQSVWVLSQGGRCSEAITLLDELTVYAEEHGWTDELSKVKLVQGMVEWRKGNFPGAEILFLQSLNLAEHEALQDEQIVCLVNLSLIYYELAEYKKAVRYGQKAERLAGTLEDTCKLPAVFANLAISHARLGEFEKAKKYLQRFISGKRHSYDRCAFRSYYFLRGTIALQQGELMRAREALAYAHRLYASDEIDRNLGKLYHNLALLSAYQGNETECREYLGKAREVFLKFDDTASSAELGLVEILRDMFCGQRADREALHDVHARLISCGSKYYAALALFCEQHLAGDKIDQNVCGSQPQHKLDSSVPLFQALVLLNSEDHGSERSAGMLIERQKKAFRALSDGGASPLAMLICQRIATGYAEIGQPKLAQAFLRHAISRAIELRNQVLAARWRDDLERISTDTHDDARLQHSLFGISRVLVEVSDYSEALQELLRFAAGQSGAERAVILLRTNQDTELRVRAQIHCDERSLIDIEKFSRTIPAVTFQTGTPLLVADALRDDRTRRYKSVIAHNILSVICVPLKINARVEGVLYLDHHTVPALFSEQDLLYISSMANFLASVLGVLTEFKNKTQMHTQLLEDLSRLGVRQQFITQSEKMMKLLEQLPPIARSTASVLLYGESGTGKEIIATLIHELSARSGGPLVKLNCAAIPSTLIESELFGVAKNSATGVAEREGKFEAADGGSIFLDEIGDMPLEIQSKILRILEYQQFERVGSNRRRSVDVRVICATNHDLRKLIETGRFRQDLFYRINTILIELLPLRERPDDIPLLVNHFVKLLSKALEDQPRFSDVALRAMCAYYWPGNVRELKNLVEKFCILYPGKTVDQHDLPSEVRFCDGIDREKHRGGQASEKARIKETLLACRWNQSKVSRELNIPLSTLRRRIKEFHIGKPT